MQAALLRKTLHEERRALMWWIAGMVASALLYISLYPSVRDSAAEMRQYLDKMPETLKAFFFGRGAVDFTTPNGYLKMEIFAFMLPLLLIIFLVAAGSRAIAGEEERGTLELLLANPVTRGRVVREKAGSAFAGILVVAGVFTVALVAGALMVDVRLSYLHLFEAVASAVLLALAFGAIALAIGCAFGRRGAAIGITGALAVAMFLVNGLGTSVSWLAPYRKLTLFYYYNEADPLVRGIDPVHALALASVAALFLVVAIVAFDRRDVRA